MTYKDLNNVVKAVMVKRDDATIPLIFGAMSDLPNFMIKDSRAYLKTQKSCIIQTKAKWKRRVRKQETMKQAYHNEQQLCEKL